MKKNASLKQRRIFVIGAATIAIAVLTTSCLTTPVVSGVPENALKVVQSVALELAGDSTILKVNAVNAYATTGEENTKISTSEYSPAEVIDEVPVRVLTAYQAGGKAGTDLNDLSGYNGRVAIEVTVQNLTVAPRDVTFDVAGESHTLSALVAVPLTVVGSTQLSGVETDAIVVNTETPNASTNGLVSQTREGQPVIQWAAILAPPQLPTTTTMRLVADVNDFQVPTFDLSVQPGMVVDASLPQLLGTSSAEEMELQQRTIDLISELNLVLGSASDTITKVSEDLSETSQTLGDQAVAELESATELVAVSAETLTSQLEALNNDLSSRLTTTNDVFTQQLAAIVSEMHAFLGDTTLEPDLPVTAAGDDACGMSVTEPEPADSMYATLMQVVTKLNGYANASAGCKAQIQQSLVTFLGDVRWTFNYVRA